MRFNSILFCAPLALCIRSAVAQSTALNTSHRVLEAQLGPYPVSIYEHEIKTSRQDPLADSPELRRLLITVYRPFLDNFTCPTEYQTYIPYAPAVISAGLLDTLAEIAPSAQNPSDVLELFNSVKVLNCSRPIESTSLSGPLVLFSPGARGTHHYYTSSLQAAASSGYTIVAVDHTYEAVAVVFPDGSVAKQSAAGKQFFVTLDLNPLQVIRNADMVSVLDAIEDGAVPGLGRYANTRHNSTNSINATSDPLAKPLRVIAYGQSLGGSTAENMLALDDRVIAANNIDGPLFGPAVNVSTSKPLFLLGSQFLSEGGLRPQLSDIYNIYTQGWKTWSYLNNTEHYSHTDIPQLADLLGLRGSFFPEALTGTMPSARIQEVVWRLTVNFFDYAWKGIRPGLLDAPSAEFPDVQLVGHAEAEKEK